MIKIKEFNYEYNKNKFALKNINLEINKGESVALIGANGSGKSTLLKLINGLIFSDKGTYNFFDEEVNEKTMKNIKFSKKLHQRIGFIFQNVEAQLFCSSVEEEVAFGPMQMDLSEEEVKKRVNDCLEILNISKLKEEIPYNLSGGEKKRVAIASILSTNPQILILDEAMNGIDPKGKRFFRDLLIKLNNAGKTIISATHDFEYMSGLFKRAIVFSEDNTIIRDGDYNEIISDKEFLERNNII